jgi:hypothetical protein
VFLEEWNIIMNIFFFFKNYEQSFLKPMPEILQIKELANMEQ